MIPKEILEHLHIAPGEKVNLRRRSTDWSVTNDLKAQGKVLVRERAEEILEESRIELAAAQELLWASDTHSVLIVLQAMDAAGKDGAIKHVFSGVNPQGCSIVSFKQPSAEELDHTFLWRQMKAAPERGKITIFNRSHYEDVLVVRVHPELLDLAQLPAGNRGRSFWQDRFDDINNFEQHLARNGTLVLKFFLHVSREEQRKRFLERLSDPEKYWKWSSGDLEARARWDDYLTAYEEAIEATSTEWAPWYIVPADQKWASRAILADVISTAIKGLNLKHPDITPKKLQEIESARAILERE